MSALRVRPLLARARRPRCGAPASAHVTTSPLPPHRYDYDELLLNTRFAAVVPGAAVPSWTYQMQAAPAAAAAATAAISPDGAVVVVCAGTWVCVLDMVLGLQRALLLMRILQPEPSALVRNASGGRANVASPCA